MLLSPAQIPQSLLKKPVPESDPVILSCLKLSQEMNEDLRRQNVELHAALAASNAKLEKICAVFDAWRAENSAMSRAAEAVQWRG